MQAPEDRFRNDERTPRQAMAGCNCSVGEIVGGTYRFDNDEWDEGIDAHARLLSGS
jgi:hypothetical protein